MKLRGRFTSIQLIFAGLCAILAASQAQAQDRLVMKNGQVREGRILSSNGTTIQIQMGAGSIGVPQAQTATVQMAPPAEFKAAQADLEKASYAAALAKTRGLVEKFRGLPAVWVEQATAMLGDIYVGMNDLPQAEEAYKNFQKNYPAAGTTRVDIGLARIAVARKDYATAKSKLTPIAATALKEKHAPASLAAGYGQVFHMLGQCRESEGDYSGALQDYLRTVTIFPQDGLAAASAQERADIIRKEHKITVP